MDSQIYKLYQRWTRALSPFQMGHDTAPNWFFRGWAPESNSPAVSVDRQTPVLALVGFGEDSALPLSNDARVALKFGEEWPMRRGYRP